MTGRVKGVPVEVKSGTNKNGKPYTIFQIDVQKDDGELIKARTFDALDEGHEVELTYNEEYKNYNASRPRHKGGGQEIDLQPIVNMLQDITNKLDRLLGNDESLIQGGVEQKAASKEAVRDWDKIGSVKPTETRNDTGGDEFPPGYFDQI